ncbi:hypothetical protein ACFYVR_18335 [Rhodococcus sp. NPDC003318]|uniref:hypothetical protein n=1 Tax=Rhodococcus sp. NPDC003318 TaxID=3364503 RepID=UPI00367DD603
MTVTSQEGAMQAKPLIAGVVSAGFLGACAWGASAVVNAGIGPGPVAPAAVSVPVASAGAY